MKLDLIGNIDSYFAGVEDACRQVRGTLAQHGLNRALGDNGAAGFQPADEDNVFSPAAEVDAPPVDPLNPSGAVSNKGVDMTATVAPRIKKGGDQYPGDPSTGNPSKKRQYIKWWDRWVYETLSGGQTKTKTEIFEGLHAAGYIKYKGEKQKGQMENRVKKALVKLEEKGSIERVSDGYNAPWRWTGGAIMVKTPKRVRKPALQSATPPDPGQTVGSPETSEVEPQCIAAAA